jgi:predicted DNA-binding transcriptional regulator AlpA
MPKQIFLTAAQVRERYGHVSRMWLYRRMEDSSFPVPVRFARLRYWRATDLDAWDGQMAAKCVSPSRYRPAATPHRAV